MPDSREDHGIDSVPWLCIRQNDEEPRPAEDLLASPYSWHIPDRCLVGAGCVLTRQDLRLELDHTLSEWGKAERARKAREENVARLKSSLQVSTLQYAAWPRWRHGLQKKRAETEVVRACGVCVQGQVEKNMLVQTQVKLLEEQVRSLTEEVGVYRQLEVYNTTLQHEFRNLRERRRKREGARVRTTPRCRCRPE